MKNQNPIKQTLHPETAKQLAARLKISIAEAKRRIRADRLDCSN